MLKNYLTVAIRNLLRNKAYTVINVSGLALGLACSLLIFLWVKDELCIDSFHENNSHLYSVYERVIADGKIDVGPKTPGFLSTELRRKIP